MRNGGVSVSNAIGRATGGNSALLPLHTALARQTVRVMRNSGINRLGTALLNTYESNRQEMSRYILNVEEAENSFSEYMQDEEDTWEPRRNDVLTVYLDGKRYDIRMDNGLTAAMKAFEPTPGENHLALKALKGTNDLFKKLCTAWNPAFLLRNMVVDAQDAAVLSTDTARWMKNFPKAYWELMHGGENWEQYKALGGSYASILDYTTGEVKRPKNIVGKAAQRFERLNQAIEAAPRLAEFMTIKENAMRDHGEVTENDLMEAFNGAADITTNFGRHGSVVGVANKFLVPFLNPSVQGLDKQIRTAIEQPSFKSFGRLAMKFALMGIVPTIANMLVYRDDEEWDDLPDDVKTNYYLYKMDDGIWFKLKKGRTVAILTAGAVYTGELLRGDEPSPRELLEVLKENISPTNLFTNNIFSAWNDAALFDREDVGRTWYGGTIESEYMQRFRPGERYDESTDKLSKAIGKAFDLSPAKINYLLDQYSGVIGDMFLPMLTPQAEDGGVLGIFKKSFTLDSVVNNETTSDYYDLLDELEWDANSGDIAAGTTLRYTSKAGQTVSEYYQQIRELEADESLTDDEKKEMVRALKASLLEYQKEILDTEEKYRLAAENYYDEHPELDHEDPAAVKAYMEQYNAQQSTEEYYKNEEKTAELMAAIVYREVNREVLGAEYALETYSDSVYERAVEVNRSAAVSYDTYYDYYFGTKDMHADRDENGESISGTKKAKVLGFIADMEISDEQKDALAIDAGYNAGSWKSYADGKRGGSSKGRGRSKKAKAVKVKNTMTKPVGISYNRSMSIAARTPKETSAYEDIQKATSQLRKKNPWYELPTGDPELDEAPPAAARYFATGRF